MTVEVFRLDLNETFPTLAHPPIVEGGIQWQARAQDGFELYSLREALAEKLPEFVKCTPIQQTDGNVFAAADGAIPHSVAQAFPQSGLRLATEDGRYVARISRDGLVFTRTAPYEHWEPFLSSARRTWEAYRELAAPMEIQQLGVRFTNHFATAKFENLGEILRNPPASPSNLPLSEFFYHSTCSVPDSPFDVRVILLMQPACSRPSLSQPAGTRQSAGLFLESAVFTTRPMETDQEAEEALVKMRWLKNKVFFSMLKPEAIQSLK